MNKYKSTHFGISEYEENKHNPSFFRKLEDGTVVSHTSLLRSATIIVIADEQNVVCETVEEGSDIYNQYGKHTVMVADNKFISSSKIVKEPIMFDTNNLVGM